MEYPLRPESSFRLCKNLVAIGVRLEWTCNVNSDVIRLILAQLGQFRAAVLKVQTGDFLVEVLRQEVNHILRQAFVVVPQFDLRQGWLAKLSDITNDGWPVAQPRLTI